MEQIQQLEQSIMTGDLDAVEKAVRQLEADPDLELIYDSAGMLMEVGLVPQADRLYGVLLERLPDAGQLKIDRAEAYMALGREDDALLLLTDIRPDEDEYLQALLLLADYYQTIGMAEVALTKIVEAEKLAPAEPVVLFAKAELLLDGGRYAEAVRLYLTLQERGIEELAGQPVAARIAEAYSAGAAYEEAVPYYERMIRQGDVLPGTLFGAAYSNYQSGHPQAALRHLDELLKMDPDYFSAYMLAGQASLLLEENKQALDYFTEGIRRDEYDKELRLSAGKAALKLSMPDDARLHFGEALALDPEYLEARISLASVLEGLGEYAELADLLKDTPEDQLDIPLLAAFRAYAEEEAERFGEAYASYAQAYTGMKEDPEFLERFAKFLLEDGRRQEAVPIVKQLTAIVPDHPEWTSFLQDEEEEEA
ncbi:TPR repeat-containing protein YpiA [Sporosarcina sp. NCCP-2716]|uniref:tetratricopeptide repeat protein n=1 Tax=Sporosarcina sp. NCCP-2716 TaxID=2943679 RepID=UPI00204162B6|nr:tetratricopeptide repeat protein [Sporosarcina sp. NCCP-2716]GKV67956.1 TPR repeat-containing protein YpiA [Sporosarcina sp. NCCP-2716]